MSENTLKATEVAKTQDNPQAAEFGNFIRAEELTKRKAWRYASLDMALFMPRYVGIGPQAKLLYSLIMHHAVMSAHNGWTDNGAVYVKLSQKDLAYALGAMAKDNEFRPADTKTVRRYLGILEAYGLISIVKCAPIKKGKIGYCGQTSKIFPLWPIVDEKRIPEHWTISMIAPASDKKVDYTAPNLVNHKQHKKAIEDIKRATKLVAAHLAVTRAEEKLNSDVDMKQSINEIAQELGVTDTLEAITEIDIRDLRCDKEYRKAKETIKNIKSSSMKAYREYNHMRLDKAIRDLVAKRDEIDRQTIEDELAAQAERETAIAAEEAYWSEINKGV